MKFSEIIEKICPAYESRNEARSVALLLLEEMFHFRKTMILADLTPDLDNHQKKNLEKSLALLSEGCPIQYVLGMAEFGDFRLKVCPGVLIPRPETWELIEWIRNSITKGPQNLVDIGCGSGCLSIALAKTWKDCQVQAWDISETALNTTQENADLQNVNVNVKQCDILNLKKCAQQFDLIVSNPPYVRNCERTDMTKRVLKFEPKEALFVDDKDPLIFYKAIVNFAKQNLKKGGMIFLEINQYLGKETLELFDGNAFNNVELKKDAFGNNRMIKAIKA